MTAHSWNDLSYFESFDLIKRVYRDINGRVPNSELTYEIVSAFVQGREYFSSASTAAEAVSPLLMYYSVLSISRAIVMLMDGRTEATLQPSHGLEALDWRNALHQTKDVFDLSVEVKRGTFADLENATQNSVMTFINGSPTSVLYPSTPEFGRTINNSISFRDIISREATLSKLYEDVTNKHACVCPGYANLNGEIFELRFHSAFTKIGDGDAIRALFQIENAINITTSTPDEESPFPYYNITIPYNDIRKLPLFESADESAGYFIAPAANGGHWSPLLRCFLQAYFLGMLARYFPSYWMGLTQGRKGDASAPLLRRTLQHLKDHFPRIAQQTLRAGRF